MLAHNTNSGGSLSAKLKSNSSSAQVNWDKACLWLPGSDPWYSKWYWRYICKYNQGNWNYCSWIPRRSASLNMSVVRYRLPLVASKSPWSKLYPHEFCSMNKVCLDAKRKRKKNSSNWLLLQGLRQENMWAIGHRTPQQMINCWPNG